MALDLGGHGRQNTKPSGFVQLILFDWWAPAYRTVRGAKVNADIRFAAAAVYWLAIYSRCTQEAGGDREKLGTCCAGGKRLRTAAAGVGASYWLKDFRSMSVRLCRMYVCNICHSVSN